MSADNGIYILESKDSYRVVYQHAIENLFCSYLNNRFDREEIVPTRAIEIFSSAPYTRDKEKAFSIALKMDEEYRTEYGVRLFYTPKSWRKLLLEAKEIAPLEIDVLKSQNRDNSYWISQLERVISKKK